ncbi:MULTISPECIES: hypothetical protein [Caballeronia]|uniref:Uncharacterized protein n=1 Tax=Caballeronia zhejiangensis TaxID=871203 RepID=A0A656QCR4_9BURK|nr:MULTISPECIES: hypothetical protein [Caballeronia]EKS71621.1 hypothetical protein BURK_007261 [Burkholderia sp. SJ98]KDR24751.1 hypothetical protein BG60_34135 [Caballeronia zhejiangensis]MDR5770138.1 hypothetical protein [Caballeronia sp. LZ028]
MQGNLERFEVDPTPRRADGEFIAHVRISISGADGSATDVVLSGDLAGFDSRAEAIDHAKQWARRWFGLCFGIGPGDVTPLRGCDA